jgi:hypothetical protein
MNAPAQAESPAPNAQLPLFFHKPAPVAKDMHAHAGLKKKAGFSFARNEISLPVTIMEVVEAAREYPLVFVKGDQPSLAAITGLSNRNLFIDENGRWAPCSYVPLCARKYPFTLAAMDGEKFALCVDEAADHFMAEGPDLPFFADGELSTTGKQAMELCRLYHGQMTATTEFCAAVQKAGLLEEKTAIITTPSGKRMSLDGFRIISEAAWKDMPAASRNVFESNNWLGLLYLIIASQCNWKYLGMRSES